MKLKIKKLKIKEEHMKYLEKAVKPYDNPSRRLYWFLYQMNHKKDGYSPKAYIWNLIRTSNNITNNITWICDNIYPYANDDNIEAAMRKTLELGKEW